jgi:hypothetical protein
MKPTHNPPPENQDAVWGRHAEALADSTMARSIVRKDVYGAYRRDGGTYTAHEPLDRELLIRHFRGEITIGAHSTGTDGRCLGVSFDIDAHDDTADTDANWRCALATVEPLASFGLKPLILDSNGKGGYHVRVHFKKPVQAAVARWVCDKITAILAVAGFTVPESFPKQGELTLDCPYGNWLRLPGRHHKRDHWTRIYDPRINTWLAGEAAVRRLIGIDGDKTDALLKSYNAEHATTETEAKKRPSATSQRSHDKPAEADVNDALGHLSNSPGAHYDTWLGVGMALHDWDEQAGLALWIAWSRGSTKFKSGECEKKWATFHRGGGLTVATIFHEAKNQGWVRRVARTAAGGNGQPETAKATDVDDDTVLLDAPPWPAPPREPAYHGLTGEAVHLIAEHTEADPVGILSQCLVAFGNAVGRGPHMVVDGVRHGVNEYLVIVGETAAARKNTAKARALSFLTDSDPGWLSHRVRSGLSSGEGLITPVRDPIWSRQPIKDKGRITGHEDVISDEGESDKRLLVIETEFGSVLRALEREGNRLSALLRSGWDGDDLATMTKSPLRATAPHISLIGHITFGELRALLSGLDICNGLANRVVWLCVRRTQHLPFGGSAVDLAPIQARFRDALSFARDVSEMTLSHAAQVVYADNYERLSTPPPGVLGEVTSRAAAHVLRWSMLYALTDRSCVVADDHVLAALALIDGSNRAAAHIFGDSLGHPDADKVLAALRGASGGLTRTEINVNVFKGNAPAGRIQAALGFLVHHGRVREEQVIGTSGRAASRYYAHERNERTEKSPNLGRVNSFFSSISCPPHSNGAGAREVFEL